MDNFADVHEEKEWKLSALIPWGTAAPAFARLLWYCCLLLSALLSLQRTSDEVGKDYPVLLGYRKVAWPRHAWDGDHFLFYVFIVEQSFLPSWWGHARLFLWEWDTWIYTGTSQLQDAIHLLFLCRTPMLLAVQLLVLAQRWQQVPLSPQACLALPTWKASDVRLLVCGRLPIKNVATLPKEAPLWHLLLLQGELRTRSVTSSLPVCGLYQLSTCSQVMSRYLL